MLLCRHAVASPQYEQEEQFLLLISIADPQFPTCMLHRLPATVATPITTAKHCSGDQLKPSSQEHPGKCLAFQDSFGLKGPGNPSPF